MAILEAKTEAGIVRGLPGWNQAVTVFKGIPYGAPPVGELRWKAPQPVEPWEGVRNCFEFGNICYQERFASEGGDLNVIGDEFYCIEWPRNEDCLYLNVWTPAKNTDEKLPVGVYFHGGGWAQGYGHLNCYDGEGFCKRGCIFVSINHRLGVFGYMAHKDLASEDPNGSTGNYGVLDLVDALKWVKNNIAAFGGDPDKVTIFGQSGGGSKVQSMLLSPLSEGLISGAIMQSGGGMRKDRGLQTMEEAQSLTDRVFEVCGVKTIEEARALDSETLIAAIRTINAGEKIGFNPNYVNFAPVADGYVYPESPYAMTKKGNFKDVPVMIGCTEDEVYAPNAEIPDLEAIKKLAAKLYGEENVDAYLKAIHYEDDKEVCLSGFRHFPRGTEGMRAGIIAWCENQAEFTERKSPLYEYFVTLIPPLCDSAHHSCEHQYVFQTIGKSKRPYTGKDWDASNMFADYWANFIKYGDPNGEGLTEWEPYTKEAPEAMFLDYEPHMAKIPETDLVRFAVDFNLDK